MKKDVLIKLVSVCLITVLAQVAIVYQTDNQSKINIKEELACIISPNSESLLASIFFRENSK